jgi:hypothetical protein
MLPYEIEIINDDSALDPANVDIYTAFNSVLETKVVN